MNHDYTHDAESPSFWGTRYSIGLVILGAIAAYFLLTEHRAHFFGAHDMSCGSSRITSLHQSPVATNYRTNRM